LEKETATAGSKTIGQAKGRGSIHGNGLGSFTGPAAGSKSAWIKGPLGRGKPNNLGEERMKDNTKKRILLTAKQIHQQPGGVT
jgi:hypothetical protein